MTRCADWFTADDLNCDAQSQGATGYMAQAMDWVYAATGGQWPGACQSTIRPTYPCQHRTYCDCRTRWQKLDLTLWVQGPIVSIDEVVVDGDIVPSTQYRLDNGRYLSGQYGTSAPNPDVLTVGGDNVDDTSFATASVSPTAGLQQLAWVYSIAASAPATPTITGAGLTWTAVATVLDTDGVRRLTLFTGSGTPTPGPLTIDFGIQSQTGASWTVAEANGTYDSATTGSVASATALTVDPSTGSTQFTVAGFGYPKETLGSATAGTGTELWEWWQPTPILGTYGLSSDGTATLAGLSGVVPITGIAARLTRSGDTAALIPWPSQDLRLASGVENTWSLTVTHGAAPPLPVIGAAKDLACQLLRRAAGGECDLPDNTTSVTQDGVSISLAIPTDGRTGIPRIDSILELYGRNRTRRRILDPMAEHAPVTRL